MPKQKIAAGQALSREMFKPGHLLKALDAYAKANPVQKSRLGQAQPETSDSSPFPSRHAKHPGVITCNTRCQNADCYRTYDNGKQVRFQAKQVFDPFNSQWKFDPGPR